MIGWIQDWGSSKFVPQGQQWFGMMTLPRELRLQDGRLHQRPVRELEDCRRDRIVHKNVPVSSAMTLPRYL